MEGLARHNVANSLVVLDELDSKGISLCEREFGKSVSLAEGSLFFGVLDIDEINGNLDIDVMYANRRGDMGRNAG